MDFPRLAAQLAPHGFVFDGFFATIQVARAARRQADSRLLPSLEETQSTHPEGDKQGDAPPALGASQDKRQRDESTHYKHGDPHPESLPPLAWANVRRTSHSFGGVPRRHLEQVPKLFDGHSGFVENPMEHLRLEWTAGVERHDNFLSGVLTMTKCNVAADLVIPIPPCPVKGSN